MKWKCNDNKFLLIKQSVVLTEHIDPVIFALDEHFKQANLIAYVTSGLRDSESQLRIIKTEITRRGLAKDYQDVWEPLTYKIMYEGNEVYGWQPAWSKLLNLGFVVNPPLPARCLMDYYRPGSTENKKGFIIGASPHTTGTAFDIGGNIDGIANETKVIKGAIGNVKGLKGCLPERNQNCLHVDVVPIDITINK